jgi:hypothetical protein
MGKKLLVLFFGCYLSANLFAQPQSTVYEGEVGISIGATGRNWPWARFTANR